MLLHLPVNRIQSPLNWRIFFFQLFYNLVDAGLYKNTVGKIVTKIAHFGKEWKPGDGVAPQALMGLFGGTEVKTNQKISTECGVDCSGDGKVLTELQVAARSRLLF